MILAIDVHYKNKYAKAVGVLFDWDDDAPKRFFIKKIDQVEEYMSGQFYKRELPCILDLLNDVDFDTFDYVLVDGHVYTDNVKTYGLGGHLWEALKSKKPIIGLAKPPFHINDKTVIPIFRGESKNPLFLSTIGIDIDEISSKIKNMKGNYRIPIILKELDRLTKED